MADKDRSFTEEEIREIGSRVCVGSESVEFCIELVEQGLISHDRGKLEKFLRDAHSVAQRKHPACPLSVYFPMSFFT